MAHPYGLSKAYKDEARESGGPTSMSAAGSSGKKVVVPLSGETMDQSGFWYDSRAKGTASAAVGNRQPTPLPSSGVSADYSGGNRWDPPTASAQPAILGSNPFNINRPFQSDYGTGHPNIRENAFGWFTAPQNLTNTIGQMTPNAKVFLANDEPEPPLLEELGINPEHILQRMKAVLFFYRVDHKLLQDCDMYGPLIIAVTLGFFLLLSGKPTFGYIYGLGIIGCLSAYLLLNLMCQTEHIELYKTMSILGYGLLPVVGLAAISIFFPLRNILGSIISIICILWCTATASRFFETALAMHQQRFLVAYPIGLLYASFVVITVL